MPPQAFCHDAVYGRCRGDHDPPLARLAAVVPSARQRPALSRSVSCPFPLVEHAEPGQSLVWCFYHCITHWATKRGSCCPEFRMMNVLND